MGVEVGYLEQVEVWGQNPLRGAGALEFGNQGGGLFPHPYPLSRWEMGIFPPSPVEGRAGDESSEKIARRRGRFCGAAQGRGVERRDFQAFLFEDGFEDVGQRMASGEANKRILGTDMERINGF